MSLRVFVIWSIGCFCVGSAAPASAEPVTILHNFIGGANDGQNPMGGLTPVGSTLYGMTGAGGANGSGTIFQTGINGGGFGLLHSFGSSIISDGLNPYGSLTAIGSTLYGLTPGGGSASNSGAVFQIGLNGAGFGILHGFQGGANDGFLSLGSLALSGSTFYGMTGQGGTANLGVVFTINANGSGFANLHSFVGGSSDGALPSYVRPVVSGNTIFGLTGGGGPTDNGVLFSMNTDGTNFGLLHTFVPSTGDGWDPLASLTLNGSTLYGMTAQGGGGAGTVFKINTDGSSYARLHTFAGQSNGDGGKPLGDLLIAGSEIYGMTSGGGTGALGTVFEMGLDGSNYSVLHNFVGGANDGASPEQGPLILIGSTLYGMTSQGGSNNDGVIFSIPVPEPSSFGLMIVAAATFFVRRVRGGGHLRRLWRPVGKE
jgi:uncharacterized repeat protein (TIGR03803 family)